MKKLAKLALVMGLVTTVSSIALTAGTASARDFKFGIYSYSNGQTFTINNRQSYESQYSGDYKNDKNAATIRRFSGYYKRWTSLIARYYGQDAVDDMNNQFGEWYGNVKYSKKTIDNSPWVTSDDAVRNAWVNGYDGSGIRIGILDDFRPSAQGQNSHGEKYAAVIGGSNVLESSTLKKEYFNVCWATMLGGQYCGTRYRWVADTARKHNVVGIAPEATVDRYSHHNGGRSDSRLWKGDYDIINLSWSTSSRLISDDFIGVLDSGMNQHARWDWDQRKVVTFVVDNSWDNLGISKNTLLVKSAGNASADTCLIGGTCDRTSLRMIKSRVIGDQTLVVGNLTLSGTISGAKAGIRKNHFVVETTGEHRNKIIVAGTSGAAAKVSGKAALIKSKFRNLNGAQLADIIKNTADDLGAPGVDNIYGYGKVNLRRALSPVGSLR